MNRNISIMQSCPNYEELYWRAANDIDQLNYHIQELYKYIYNLQKEIEDSTSMEEK